jgi:hypothetical protein
MVSWMLCRRKPEREAAMKQLFAVPCPANRVLAAVALALLRGAPKCTSIAFSSHEGCCGHRWARADDARHLFDRWRLG